MEWLNICFDGRLKTELVCFHFVKFFSFVLFCFHFFSFFSIMNALHIYLLGIFKLCFFSVRLCCLWAIIWYECSSWVTICWMILWSPERNEQVDLNWERFNGVKMKISKKNSTYIWKQGYNAVSFRGTELVNGMHFRWTGIWMNPFLVNKCLSV